MSHKNIQKLMAFDFGLRRIGVATGQTITRTASVQKSILNSLDSINWLEIEKTIQRWRPDLIVIGLPIDAHGFETDITISAKNFAQTLSTKVTIPIELMDERYTTREAKGRLKEMKGGKSTNHLKVDSISAQIILETWLNHF